MAPLVECLTSDFGSGNDHRQGSEIKPTSRSSLQGGVTYAKLNIHKPKFKYILMLCFPGKEVLGLPINACLLSTNDLT